MSTPRVKMPWWAAYTEPFWAPLSVVTLSAVKPFHILPSMN